MGSQQVVMTVEVVVAEEVVAAAEEETDEDEEETLKDELDEEQEQLDGEFSPSFSILTQGNKSQTRRKQTRESEQTNRLERQADGQRAARRNILQTFSKWETGSNVKQAFRLK